MIHAIHANFDNLENINLNKEELGTFEKGIAVASSVAFSVGNVVTASSSVILGAVKPDGFLNQLNRPIETIAGGVRPTAAAAVFFMVASGVLVHGVAREMVLNLTNEQFRNGTEQLRLQQREPTVEEASVDFISCNDWNELLK